MFAGLALIAGASAAEPLPPEQRAGLERVALARARAALLDTLNGLPAGGRETVGTLIGRDVRLDRAWRLWVRTRPVFGGYRLFSDQTCDADVRAAPDEVLTALLQIADEVSPAIVEPTVRKRLKAAAGDWPLCYGTGTAERKDVANVRKPAGWADVSIEGIEVTRRAASADAIRALLGSTATIKVTNARQLSDLVEHSVSVRDAFRVRLAEGAKVEVRFAADQVATATAEIRLADLIRVTMAIHEDLLANEPVFGARDFSEMVMIHGSAERVVRATGIATPPASAITHPTYSRVELDRPAWAARKLTATGTFTPEDGPSQPLEQALARDVARLHGIDSLREQVLELPLGGSATVAALIDLRPELKDDIVTGLHAARPVRTTVGPRDGAVTVTLELPLERLWWIVRRGMDRVDVFPTDAPAPVIPQPATAEEE